MEYIIKGGNWMCDCYVEPNDFDVEWAISYAVAIHHQMQIVNTSSLH